MTRNQTLLVSPALKTLTAIAASSNNNNNNNKTTIVQKSVRRPIIGVFVSPCPMFWTTIARNSCSDNSVGQLSPNPDDDFSGYQQRHRRQPQWLYISSTLQYWRTNTTAAAIVTSAAGFFISCCLCLALALVAFRCCLCPAPRQWCWWSVSFQLIGSARCVTSAEGNC